jgi:hypothetical protein
MEEALSGILVYYAAQLPGRFLPCRARPGLFSAA